MPATDLPTLRADEAWTDEKGRPSLRLFRWLAAATLRMGGADDKIDAAFVAASAAVPQTVNVVGAGGLHAGGPLSADVGIVLYKATTGVASLPASGNATGDLAFAFDLTKPGETTGNGTGGPVVWSAGHWYSLFSGAIAAS